MGKRRAQQNKLNIKRLRGSTLIEVCITIALIAIVSAMVASFCAITIGNVGVYQKYNKLENEFFTCEKEFSAFVSYYDTSDYTFQTCEGGISALGNDNAYHFTMKDGVLTRNFGDERTVTEYAVLQALTAEVYSGGDGQLIKLTFSYVINDKEGEYVLYKTKRSEVAA